MWGELTWIATQSDRMVKVTFKERKPKENEMSSSLWLWDQILEWIGRLVSSVRMRKPWLQFLWGINLV